MFNRPFLRSESTERAASSSPGLVPAIVLALLAVIVQAPRLASQEASYHYVYADEARELLLDSTRIAVFCDGDPLAIVRREMGEDISREQIVPAGIPGVYFFRLRESEQNSTDVESLVERLGRVKECQSSSPVFFDELGGALYFEPVVLLGFKADKFSLKQQRKVISSLTGVSDLLPNWGGMPNTWSFRVRGKSGLEALHVANSLAMKEGVAWAEPSAYFSGQSGYIPNDVFFGAQWAFDNTGQSGGLNDFDMDVAEAWDITKGSGAIKIVIFESGIEMAHPDLNMIAGADFTNDPLANNGNPVNMCEIHGTAVAGCITARIDNNIGGVGVAPKCFSASARTFIADISLCNGSWNGTSAATVNGLNWANSIGARVTNNSNFYGFTSNAIANAYSNTKQLGIIHFASAGNSGIPGLKYPASLAAVNAVGAVDRFGALATFSSTGPGLAFVAPGVDILTTDRLGALGYSTLDYAVIYGTSFSSPYAAGIAALMLSFDPTLTPVDIETILQATAQDLGPVGYDTTFGAGLLNAKLALQSLGGSVMSISGQTLGEQFGRAVDGVGDVNGDGYPDFLVGAPKSADFGINSGEAFVYSGKDLSVLYQMNGSSLGDQFGRDVAGVGDVNGDGTPDFAVGASQEDSNGNNAGSATIFSGADGGILYTFLGSAAGDEFGRAIDGAGDVNGDGFADVIIGARLHDGVGPDSGSALVFSGIDGSILFVFDGSQGGVQLGGAVSGAGDVNLDGFADVIVGSRFDDGAGTNAGAAFVYSGFDGSILLSLQGSSANEQFGWSVGGGGDVDCDGYGDVIVGIPLANDNGTDAGRVVVISGATGLPLHILLGAQVGDQFGFSVDMSGDVNGDGFDDVIGGAPFAGNLIANGGSVRVFSGYDGSNIREIDGQALGGRLGSASASMGDANLDGFADILAGAHLNDDSGIGAGSVTIGFSPVLPSLSYDFSLSGLDLKVVWVPNGGDPFAGSGTLLVTGATPGGLGLSVVSLAPTVFPSGFGFPLLIATDSVNLIETGTFGFDASGKLMAPNISRYNAALAGTSVYIQIFETAPFIFGSNGLKLVLAP